MEISSDCDKPSTNMVEDDNSSSSSDIQQSFITTVTNEEYTREKIQRLLKLNKGQYVVINNSNNKRFSNCWKLFGFPAKIDENGHHQRIPNLVSCKKCFATYSYISNSTSFLNKHDCHSSRPSKNKTSSPSSRTSSVSHSQRLITDYGNPKSIRLPETYSTEMKDLITRWVCQDMRPFAVVDDDGFRDVAQRCISIGKSLISNLDRDFKSQLSSGILNR